MVTENSQLGGERGEVQSVPGRFAGGWLDRLDGRTELARNLRARYRELTDDLGGADRLCYAQRSLAERALWLEYWLATQERELAAGRDFDVGKWTQAFNSLQGVYGKLGLERATKDVPSLGAYLKGSAA